MASTIAAAGAGLALLVAAGAAQAQTQATPLPDGQVLLEIGAHGSAHTPADSVTLNLQVTSGARTAIAAKTANQAKLATLIKSLEPLGIQPKDIDQTWVASMGMDDEDSGPPQIPLQFAQATVQVTLADPSKLAAVREVLNRQDVGQLNVLPTAKDSAVARRLAIADAVAKAKADAATYAEAVGLRIVKIVRVSNVAPVNAQTYASFAALLGPQKTAAATQVETPADVTIEFLAVPK